MSVAGNNARFDSTLCPATNSGSTPVIAAAVAFSRALSIQLPITGFHKLSANIPAPPIIDIPRAPLSGMFSATKPTMVGQKYITPIANNMAAI